MLFQGRLQIRTNLDTAPNPGWRAFERVGFVAPGVLIIIVISGCLSFGASPCRCYGLLASAWKKEDWPRVAA